MDRVCLSWIDYIILSTNAVIYADKFFNFNVFHAERWWARFKSFELTFKIKGLQIPIIKMTQDFRMTKSRQDR